MKKMTQEEFDAIERNDKGIKVIPSFTDMSDIKSFGKDCSFGHYCSFGEGCIFGDYCRFGQYCSFGKDCSFGKGCSWSRAIVNRSKSSKT